MVLSLLVRPFDFVSAIHERSQTITRLFSELPFLRAFGVVNFRGIDIQHSPLDAMFPAGIAVDDTSHFSRGAVAAR